MSRLLESIKVKNKVFGVNVYTASPIAIELSAKSNLDFVFIDTEHSTLGVDEKLERLILSANASNIDALVRVSGDRDSEIRRVLEMGASGVILPQIHSAEQLDRAVKVAKFPPLGRRGGDSSVRSAGFGGGDFNWSNYIKNENKRSLIIPMAESYEFFDNIDDILSVPHIDAVHFGPADYALSIGKEVDYNLNSPVVRECMDILIAKCQERNINLMIACYPMNKDALSSLIKRNISMILMGGDVSFIKDGLGKVNEAIDEVSF